MTVAKPIIILPDTFTGEGQWENFAVHFEHCADINLCAEASLTKYA